MTILGEAAATEGGLLEDLAIQDSPEAALAVWVERQVRMWSARRGVP